MIHCTQCGAEVPEGKRFCTSCGAPVQMTGAAFGNQIYSDGGNAAAQEAYAPEEKYALISTGGYIGIMLLMCIPILGQILMIVWACGGCKKLQKRNLARAACIMTVITLILSAIAGFAGRSLWKQFLKAVEQESGIPASQFGSIPGGSGGSAGTQNEQLDELEKLLDSVGALTGDSSEEGSGYSGLIEGAKAANEDAAAHSNGWPSDLPDYPSGTVTELASYRSEISGTSYEEMLAYIETLKKKGYAYEDFYDFGMSEEDMISYGWWGTNGELYISLACDEDKVTIDYVTELPDLESYFK